jgi:hypothetical protein
VLAWPQENCAKGGDARDDCRKANESRDDFGSWQKLFRRYDNGNADHRERIHHSERE